MKAKLKLQHDFQGITQTKLANRAGDIATGGFHTPKRQKCCYATWAETDFFGNCTKTELV